MKTLVAMLRDDAGATLAEYGLVLALVGLAMIGALSAVATAANGQLQNTSDGLQTVTLGS